MNCFLPSSLLSFDRQDLQAISQCQNLVKGSSESGIFQSQLFFRAGLMQVKFQGASARGMGYPFAMSFTEVLAELPALTRFLM
jgi:hypothetical protein